MPPPPPECLSRPGGIRIMAPKIFPKIFPQNPPKKFKKIFLARKTLKRKHVKAYFIRACGYTHTREEKEKKPEGEAILRRTGYVRFSEARENVPCPGESGSPLQIPPSRRKDPPCASDAFESPGNKKAFERESQESQVETPMTPNRKRGGPPGSKDSKPRKRRSSNSPKRCIKKYGGDSRQPRSDIPLMTKRCSYKCTRE